jgi:hypothetical protein
MACIGFVLNNKIISVNSLRWLQIGSWSRRSLAPFRYAARAASKQKYAHAFLKRFAAQLKEKALFLKTCDGRLTYKNL